MLIAIVFLVLLFFTLSAVVMSSITPLHRRVTESLSQIDNDVKRRLELTHAIIQASSQLASHPTADEGLLNDLYSQLAELDGKISFSKQAFNNAVIDYHSQRGKIVYKVLGTLLKLPNPTLVGTEIDESPLDRGASPLHNRSG